MSEKNHSNFTIIKYLYRFVKPYSSRFYVSIFFAILLAVLAIMRPFVTQKIIDDYILKNKMEWLGWMAMLLLSLLIVETAVKYLFIFITNWLGQQVIKELRIAIFKKILNFKLSYFNHTPVGTAVSRTITDVETINDIFSEGIIAVLADLMTIVAVITIMLISNWRLTLITLAVFPFLLIATYYFKETVKKAYQAERTQINNLYAFLQEHISGMSVIKLFTAETREMKKFSTINADLKQANINGIWAYSVFFPVVELISAIAVALVIWWGAHGVLQNICTVGTLIAFMMYINLLFRPLRAVADKFNTLQRGMIAGERVMNILESKETTTDDGKISSQKMIGEIKFENVSFEYEEGKPILKNVSFTAKAGETIAIVGATGSGKTTIISLLNRMYDITEGKILIDDVSIKDYKLENLRGNIGVVLQDVFLFSGSVADNISLNNKAITQQQMEEAAKLVGLHDFILQLPDEYNYKVMERGSTLSLGQRQLISFIRALVFNPSILVLDEATSSVDHHTEQQIQTAIDTLIKGRTSIIIAHRLSTIKKANQIIVLDKGEVKEIGTHESLLAENGLYAKLYEQQFSKIETV